MKLAPDLDQILAKIKDMQEKMSRFAINMDQIQREIDTLEQLAIELKNNLVELKRERIIALAVDYKKAKEDLNRTLNRLAFLRIDKDTFLKAYLSHEKVLNIFRKEYADNLKKSTNKVIRGKFGKDGK